MSVTALTNTNALRALDDQQMHTSKAGDSIAKLSSGQRITKASEDSSASAIAAQLGSEAKVLMQSKVNASNAISMVQVVTGALSSQRDIYTNLKALATQASNGDLKDSTRLLIDKEFQQQLTEADEIAKDTNWNGLKMLNGGAAATPTLSAVTAANAATGLNASGTSFATAIGAATRGYVNGAVVDGSLVVDQVATGVYHVAFQVGNQVFENKSFTPTNAGEMLFSSTTDSGNILNLTQGAGAAAAMTSVATVKTEFQNFLGLTANTPNAQFQSTSAALTTGVTNVSATSNLTSGEYALSYDNVIGKFKVTGGPDGKAFYSEKIAAAPTAGSTASYNVNGFVVTVDSTFVPGNAGAQMVFNVAKGGTVSVSFQTGSQSGDTVSVDFQDATNVGRNINGLSVTTVANANVAMSTLGRVIDDVSGEYSTLGAKQGRLESTIKNLETSTRNLLSAKANYTDADIAKTLTEFTISNTMAQVANVAISKSLEQTQQLLGLVNKS
ncbi:flagellin N-terminal helical domain-containing protein [Candidatus Nucleicultrix amoebiphila]|jgi:flagellin|uniref:Flagellin n=1 Tax=Candidatus Nucleicultrix amoebiphila FS5 TaxID=1414854 RepID=A0A1W6N2G1_9PROT|nr:flagellin [Candidatus Nucleicultrix amoebiphila]ARN84023.1 hypothetical protein GQ61_00140 [Candidatus Nucleicultrix amoebiphila FS5]